MEAKIKTLFCFLYYVFFRRLVWKSSHENRKYFFDEIINNNNLLGVEKKHIEDLFGEKDIGSYPNKWRYEVCIKDNKMFFLDLYFENDYLIDIRYEYSIIK